MSHLDTPGRGSDGGSSAAAVAGDPTPARAVGAQLADLLVQAGHLAEDQLRIATRIHAKVQATRTLTSVLLEKKSITQQQLRDVLRTGKVRAPLGDVLVEVGLLAGEELKLALAMQREKPSASLEEVLIDNHFVSEYELMDIVASQLGLASPPLHSAQFDPALLKKAPFPVYKTQSFLPLRRDGASVVVVFAEPTNAGHVETARKYFGRDLTVALATRKMLQAAIGRAERELAAAVAAAQNPARA